MAKTIRFAFALNADFYSRITLFRKPILVQREQNSLLELENRLLAAVLGQVPQHCKDYTLNEKLSVLW